MLDVVAVDGVDVAYERVGEGPPVVLLHGYVGDGSTTWRRQLEAFADEFAVIAWDAPGAGRSSDPAENFGIAGYADCAAGFVTALGLRRPHVAGLSFGGIVALELCRRHPTLPRSLVLASAYAGWAGSLPAEVAAERLRQAIALSELSPEQFVATLLPTMFSEGTPQDTIDEFGAAMRAFHPIGFRAMARASAEDVRDAVGSVAVPTLLVCGDRDVRAPLAVAEQLHEAIGSSRLVVLPNAGHVCNVEAPDDFNEAVLTFLRQNSQ
jgi:pimeloyl-ACP methyl ester carboxylesterase